MRLQKHALPLFLFSLLFIVAALPAQEKRAVVNETFLEAQDAEENGQPFMSFSIIPTVKPQTTFSLVFKDGKERKYNLGIGAQKGEKLKPKAADAPKNAKDEYETVDIPDSYASFQGGIRIFSRPNLFRYTDKQQSELLDRINAITPASKRQIHFDLKKVSAGIELWINGCYGGLADNSSGLKGVKIFSPSEEKPEAQKYKTVYRVPDAFLPLEISKIFKNPSPFKVDDLKLTSAAEPTGDNITVVENIPFYVSDMKNFGDVGETKEMKGSWALECDEHLSRQPWDAMPESLLFSVPQKPFYKAHVLCAVRPAGTVEQGANNELKEDPVFTARITRFATSGRGGAISNNTVTLPDSVSAVPDVPGRKVVGTVTYNVDGKETKVPLFYVEIPLDIGSILDIINSSTDPRAGFLNGQFLDFEFVGKIAERSFKPDKKSKSKVNVFGVTLEQAPVVLEAKSIQPGNIFNNDERPGMNVILKPLSCERTSLIWEIRDVNDKTVESGQKDVKFENNSAVEIPIEFSTTKVGWYSVDFTLNSDKGKSGDSAPASQKHPVLKHQASFAVLGKDFRKAGYESPFGVWWFGGAHYGCDDLDTIGPILFKGGFRKTTFNWTKYTEADAAKYLLTQAQIGWYGGRKRTLEFAEQNIREMREKFPHCKNALVFHESYSYYLPSELFGVPKEEDEKAVENGKLRVKTATDYANMMREKFPEVKLVWGNSGVTASLIASLFRYGLDPKFVDYIGLETSAGQHSTPERLNMIGPQAAYLIKDVAARFGHKDIPLTGCYEYTYRSEYTLGRERQAQYYTRDILISMGYGFELVMPGLLNDAGNAYFHDFYGKNGILHRAPLLYPKAAYVAMAALTNALDQCKYIRRFPTGSASVYVIEFKREDGGYAYAMWTPRASVNAKLDFGGKTDVRQFSFYGEVTDGMLSDGKLDLAVSASPQYIQSANALRKFSVLKQISEEVPGGFKAASKLSDIKNIIQMRDYGLMKIKGDLPRYVTGDFAVRQVKDEESGECVEVELLPSGELSEYVGEYCTLAFKEPLKIEGEPHTVGMWVKGNSSWGKIVFEFIDSNGVRWRSDANEHHDWMSELSINFDGWHFISFPIDKKSPMNYRGALFENDSGAKEIKYPISFTRLYVILNRKVLDLNKMIDVSNKSVRIRDIGAY